jgi:cation diffusion facilitator family transporter
MHYKNLHLWQHAHAFGQDRKQPGELRTETVAGLTVAMMIIELVAGLIFGSMALLADGLHMASHAAALGISALAYVYSRRHACDAQYCFGTGKVNALGGFTSAVLLMVFALAMAWGSIGRIAHPVTIAFDQAILVAIAGLVVNAVSAFILDLGHADHSYDHASHESHEHHHDHLLRSAYLHVLADALTSVLAILALLAAKYVRLIWMDPVMGIVGSVLVSYWSLGLLRATSSALLDRRGPGHLQARIKACIENDGDNRVADLHLWSIGPSTYGLIITVVTHHARPPEYYKQLLPADMNLAHVTVEVHQCADNAETETRPASQPTA